MALISLKQLLDHAAEHCYGLPAFNVNNMEQIKAVMQAADKLNSAVIMQASSGARAYAGEFFLREMMSAAINHFPHIPVCIHQDHGTNLKICLEAIKNGFSSVMIDGSLMADGKTPSTYEYNVDITERVCQIAHTVGVSVEGELGCLGSLETGLADQEDGVGAEGILNSNQLLTNPSQAKDFINKTKIDALAIAIGTSHGAYKFSKPPTKEVLVIDQIKAINKKVPNTHLVMHGASSIDQKWLDMIREFGGDINETYGVPIEEILQGIKYGVRKINIDTDIRLAMTAGMRKALHEKKFDFDPRFFLKSATICAQQVCEDKFISFGSAGYADKIKSKPLSKMADIYS